MERTPAEIGTKLKWNLEITLGGLHADVERDEFRLAGQLLARRRIVNVLLGAAAGHEFAALSYDACVRGVLELLASGRLADFQAALRTEHSLGCLLYAAYLEVLLRGRAEADDDVNCGAEVRRLAKALVTRLNAGWHLTPADLARLSVFDTWPLHPKMRLGYQPDLPLNGRLMALPDGAALWDSVAREAARPSMYLFACGGRPAILPRTGDARLRDGERWKTIDVWTLLAKGECLPFRTFQSRWPGLVSPDDYLRSFDEVAPTTSHPPKRPAPMVAVTSLHACVPGRLATGGAAVWTARHVEPVPWALIRRSPQGQALQRFLRQAPSGRRDSAPAA